MEEIQQVSATVFSSRVQGPHGQLSVSASVIGLTGRDAEIRAVSK